MAEEEPLGDGGTRCPQIFASIAPPVGNVGSINIIGVPKGLDDDSWPSPVMPQPKSGTVTGGVDLGTSSSATGTVATVSVSAADSGVSLPGSHVSASQPVQIALLSGGKRKQRKDRMSIERANLLSICKLVVKELIDLSLSLGRTLEDDHDPIVQFFIVMDHILLHGAKAKRSGLLRDRRDCWSMLEQHSKFVPDATDLLLSIRDLSNAKTGLGKTRAWLRLSLMQKTLPDYFRVFVDKRDQLLLDYYEPGAMMLEDEAAVVAGLLVGLNVIDCNMTLKDDDLDQALGVIDYSLYLKEIMHSPAQEDEQNGTEDKLGIILDQKNYLEELNRHLTTTVTNLNQKLDVLQATNILIKEEVANAQTSLIQLQQENSLLRCENHALADGHQRQLQTAQQDIQIERDTYQQSRQGLDSLYQEVKRKLQDETQMRLDVERELQLQIGMKQEMEVALRLLEKDGHDKQELTSSLRKQLEDIKAINIDMYTRLQSAEAALQHKNDMVNRLEIKSNQMVATIRDMEESLQRASEERRSADEMSRKLGLQLTERDVKRSGLETDLKVEREWRGTLQKSLETEKAHLTKVNAELKHLSGIKKEYDALQAKYMQLQQICDDHEKTLAELGSHLSQSKLKMEDLKESQLAIKDAQWAEDKEVANCKQCTKPFSVSRRRHHCRNCGEIFCNECSNTKMPLPSSAKPVRVCDACNNILLQRYASN